MRHRREHQRQPISPFCSASWIATGSRVSSTVPGLNGLTTTITQIPPLFSGAQVGSTENKRQIPHSPPSMETEQQVKAFHNPDEDFSSCRQWHAKNPQRRGERI